MKFLVFAGLFLLSSIYTHAFSSTQKLHEALKESAVDALIRPDGLTSLTVKSSHRVTSVQEADLNVLKQMAIDVATKNILTLVDFFCEHEVISAYSDVDPICDADYSGDENFAECEIALNVICK